MPFVIDCSWHRLHPQTVGAGLGVEEDVAMLPSARASPPEGYCGGCSCMRDAPLVMRRDARPVRSTRVAAIMCSPVGSSPPGGPKLRPC